MRKLIALFLILTLAEVAACDGLPVWTSAILTSPVPDLGTIAANYPKVDGSTSSYPLHMMALCKVYGLTCSWHDGFLTRERMILPEALPAGFAYGPELSLPYHNGTHEAYMNLIAGDAELILVARAPSIDELMVARRAGVALDVTAIALDAFVFLVNARNPVDNLRLEQARGIYTGRLTDWAQVGGPAGKIQAYQRERNSGSQELMEALVMKGAGMIEAPDMLLETMIGPINAMRDDPLGIGYSVYYYVTHMLPDGQVRMVGVDGVQPTADSIASRSYPLVAEVYAVLRRSQSRGSTAVVLRDWLRTASGRAAIAESGYIPAR